MCVLGTIFVDSTSCSYLPALSSKGHLRNRGSSLCPCLLSSWQEARDILEELCFWRRPALPPSPPPPRSAPLKGAVAARSTHQQHGTAPEGASQPGLGRRDCPTEFTSPDDVAREFKESATYHAEAVTSIGGHWLRHHMLEPESALEEAALLSSAFIFSIPVVEQDVDSVQGQDNSAAAAR